MIQLYNTLTQKKEEFETIEPDIVRLYVCGVTVYNDAHVGHAMSALVFDIMRRYLEYRGYTVRHVMNYTDVDDKIIRRANELGEEPLKLSQRYIEDYANDLDNLNVLPATSNPRVSKTMPLIIEFVEGLIKKEAAYAAPNGDVYFSVDQLRQLRETFQSQTGGYASRFAHRSRRSEKSSDGFRPLEGRETRRDLMG